MIELIHYFILNFLFNLINDFLLTLLVLETCKLVLRQCGKCSKILNTSCLPKRPRQTGQTQNRLLLKKQSDQGIPCLLFCQVSIKDSFFKVQAMQGGLEESG